MKIALVQQETGHDREDNRVRELLAVDEAVRNGASIICFAKPQTSAL